MKTKSFALLILLLAVSPMASFAQGGKPSGGSSSPNTSSASTDPSKYANRDWNTMMHEGRAGDYLIGNVVVAAGQLPWDPIAIAVTCDGKARYTTKTDPKGYFLIARVEPPGSTTAKADQKPVASQYAGCNVEAALPGFDSAPLPVGNRNVNDSPNLGTITLHREAGSGDTSLSSTTAAAPKEALKLFEKARNEAGENKIDRAEHDLQKATQAYPQFAEAWYQLGKLEEISKSPDAGVSFSKAVAADPKFALPYEHMALLAAQSSNWQELVSATDHWLELDPRGSINIWYYNALGNYKLQKLDVAQTSAEKSLAMDPLHVQPVTEQLLAVILAQKQDYAGALAHLRNCLTYMSPGPNLDLVKQQVAQLEAAVGPPK